MRLEDVKGDMEWSALEERLLDCAPQGKVAVLPGKGDCPEDTTDPARRVRAGLIRWLLLGGDEADAVRTHPKGVRLRGAWVDGVLDFEGCKTRLDCSLLFCLFSAQPSFRDAELRGLYLRGAHCRQGLDLHRLKTETSVHLSGGFKGTGLVNLGGARIGGQLSCIGGQFRNPGRTALQCNAATVGAAVLLRGGFKVTGRVNFVRASVGGTLQIRTAMLDGVFDGRHMAVKAGFFWQAVNGSRKVVDLRHASLGVLRDDKASWDGVGTLHLDGLTYDRIDSAMTVQDRIAWLDRNRDGAEDAGDRFLPQPWTQLAKVLTASGDRRAASRVREAREVRMERNESRQGWKAAGLSCWGPFPYIPVLAKCFFNLLFRGLFGYGHAPGRVWFTIIPLLIGTALLFGHIYDMGQTAPNSAVILTSADWLGAVYWAERMHISPMHIWAGTGAFAGMPSAIDYETFRPLLYAFDLLVPLVDIGQVAAWAPSPGRGGLGCFGQVFGALAQAVGWVIAAVGAAVVTGLVGKKDDG